MELNKVIAESILKEQNKIADELDKKIMVKSQGYFKNIQSNTDSTIHKSDSEQTSQASYIKTEDLVKIIKERNKLDDYKRELCHYNPNLKYETVINIAKAKSKEEIYDILSEAKIATKKSETEENKQGHLSTRHKKPAPMYLDEALADIAEKENQTNYHQVKTDKEEKIGNVTTSSYTQYPMTPDESYYTLNLELPGELKDNTFPQKTEKQGVKHNKGKLPLDTMITKQFPNALEAVCKATVFGHEYYKEFDADWLNYQRVEGGSQVYAEAMLRHNMDKVGLDDKSGLPHIYHVVWNAMAMLELWLKENSPKTIKQNKF